MIKISNAREINIDKHFLSVNGEKSCMIISLGLIDHVKLERKTETQIKMKSNDNVIVLYNICHQVLYRLMIADTNLSFSVFYTLSSIIKQRAVQNV